jgi:hypothetical protein
MRRFSATLLLALLLLGVALPLLQAQAGAVPACCRRGGNHHCMMMSLGGDGFRSPSADCPYRHRRFCRSHSNGIREAMMTAGPEIQPAELLAIDSPALILPGHGNAQKRAPPVS